MIDVIYIPLTDILYASASSILPQTLPKHHVVAQSNHLSINFSISQSEDVLDITHMNTAINGGHQLLIL